VFGFFLRRRDRLFQPVPQTNQAAAKIGAPSPKAGWDFTEPAKEAAGLSVAREHDGERSVFRGSEYIDGALTVRVERQIGPVYAALAACLAFSLLVLFGEILPKSVSYANSRPVSIAAAVPAFMCLKVLTPIILVFRLLIVEPTLRLLLGPSRPRPAKAITTDEFKSLIEHVRKRGLITADENRLLGEIIELSFLKVRHVMRPRVDMITCSVTERPGKARELMQKNHLTKLPVYVGTRDNIVGLVSLRRLLLELDKSLDRLVQEVHFVPEQKTVESLLEFFRRSRSDTAIVVDEYGGIAGSIRLEDIAEELFGPIEVTEQIQPIEQIGPFEYRLAGHLAIHDWADVFSIDPEETRISTVGGLVTAALGKIPKAGDIVYLKNLKLTVERVRKHRIETLILSLSRLANNAQ
jgi:CBS domain containing-hemolysin-like protein